MWLSLAWFDVNISISLLQTILLACAKFINMCTQEWGAAIQLTKQTKICKSFCYSRNSSRVSALAQVIKPRRFDISAVTFQPQISTSGSTFLTLEIQAISQSCFKVTGQHEVSRNCKVFIVSQTEPETERRDNNIYSFLSLVVLYGCP